FECTKSDQCDEGHAVKYATYGQAASNRDGALTLKYARDVGFSGCTVRNVGNYGVELVYGCQGFFFEKGEICHTGAGGIKALGVGVAGNERDVNTGIRVEDCSIHDCTLVDYGAIGIFIAHGNGIRLAHNDIYNLKYSGISVGWVWGMTPARTGNAVIEYNHIHHRGDGDMSDMGGIYLWGPQVGTEVRGNYIHDIHRANYGGWGIYLDEGSTGILVERNVVYDCDTSSFMIHYGTENIVRYNIFGEGKDACVCIGAAVNYDTIYATMMKNIFYYTGKSAVYNGAFNVTLDFPILATDCNFFYRPDNTPLYNLVDPKEVPAFHQSFDTWRFMGNDVFSKEYPAGERLTAVPAELKAFGVPDVDAAYAGRRKG
ncbi:MAG: right-handed parallel beta-helix repeat-containing protein, partial [Clostridia bacterium]|nr:right-handed parallel beta-helix repeat-containing protein [Clostridia bacterium]